ncbi:uncharacterized protein LOC108732795 [Agrilus planipennis]|uniref:Uncharacterized protein LOC108732795 n=1 Tax=Agrilus planipennis TaxID=224129 RepID=A0A1W4W548_AGRPL|nr:uncharacterized protein LOC108732795 [Agrilus planipennis]
MITGEHQDNQDFGGSNRKIHPNNFDPDKTRSIEVSRTTQWTTGLQGHQKTRPANSIPIISTQSRQKAHQGNLAEPVVDIEANNRWNQLGHHSKRRTSGPPGHQGITPADPRIRRHRDLKPPGLEGNGFQDLQVRGLRSSNIARCDDLGIGKSAGFKKLRDRSRGPMGSKLFGVFSPQDFRILGTRHFYLESLNFTVFPIPKSLFLGIFKLLNL